MSELLISGVDVLRCSEGSCEVVPNQDILVRGQRIAAIGAAGSIGSDVPCTEIRGEGMVAMPGLINTHAHTPMCIFRGLALSCGPRLARDPGGAPRHPPAGLAPRVGAS